MQTGDPYKVLGLKVGASPDEIRSAYRRLVKKYHPDRNPSASAATQFIAVQTAYEQLSSGQNAAAPDAVEQHYRARQAQYDQDLEAYKQQRAAAREKIRQRKQNEEAYKMAYLQKLKSGKIGFWHRAVACLGALLFVVLWTDFFLPEKQTPIRAAAYGLHTYSSVDGHLVQLFKSTDERAFWVADYLSQNLQKTQNLRSIETPWLHQVKALTFHDGPYTLSVPIHFSFYWAQIWLSLLFLIPLLSWYFASADIIFVAGSFVSRYAILGCMLWFLLSENRFIHLLSFGQL
jgi:curved DNA-binding protein CbpA